MRRWVPAAIASCALLALVALTTPARAETVVMHFVGDVAFPDGRAFIKRVDKRRHHLFRWVKPVLDAGELNFANLECPLSVRAHPPVGATRLPWVYRCHPRRLGYLLDAGFNLFSLANNHALDQGTSGTRETLLAMREVQPDDPRWWAGLDAAPQTKLRPVRITRRGQTVAFFAVAEVAPPQSLVTSLRHPNLKPALGAARKRGDVVVVSVHAGSEYVHLPTAGLAETFRGLIDAGADLVVGHHPHVIQGIERHAHGVILYSLGNFSFSTYSTRHRKQGARMYSLIARVRAERGRLSEVELVPLWVDDTAAWRIGDEVLDPRPAEPQLLGGAFADRVLRELVRFSRAIPGSSTKIHRLGTRAFVDLGRGRGIPQGPEGKRRQASQRRAYQRVISAGVGPRPAKAKERFDTQGDAPAALRDRYRE